MSRECYDDATRKTASVEFKLYVTFSILFSWCFLLITCWQLYCQARCCFTDAAAAVKLKHLTLATPRSDTMQRRCITRYVLRFTTDCPSVTCWWQLCRAERIIIYAVKTAWSLEHSRPTKVIGNFRIRALVDIKVDLPLTPTAHALLSHSIHEKQTTTKRIGKCAVKPKFHEISYS